jgi:hypothetical protein
MVMMTTFAIVLIHSAERHRLDVFPLVDRICGVVGIVALMLRYLHERRS